MGGADIKEVVKEKYSAAALRVKSGGSSCCGAAPAPGHGGCDPITSNLYDLSQASQIPEEALLASLGCGNPTALANLNPGEVVLEFLSAQNIDVDAIAPQVDGKFMSAFIRAVKPRKSRPCCGPTCCD